MRYGWLLCLGSLLAGGCFGHPMQVQTDSRISIATPLNTHVQTDTPPTRDVGPLAAVTVAGASNCRAAKVYVIDVDGVLVNTNLVGPYSQGENPLSLFREKLDAAAADPQLGGVVLRINSPGGGAAVSDMMLHELERFKARTGVPIVAIFMEVAAGGAYYLALGADAIYAQPSTITGGIGVILNLFNLQDTMGQVNVLGQPIKAGENIDMGTSTRTLTPEVRDWLQGMANEFHERFKRVVTARRPQVPANDPTIFDGRVFTAEQARARGLIDQVGYLDDAIAAVQARSGCAVRVVMLRRGNEQAHTPYSITANDPGTFKLMPMDVPGLDRSRLPTFLYIWLPEPSLDRNTGR